MRRGTSRELVTGRQVHRETQASDSCFVIFAAQCDLECASRWRVSPALRISILSSGDGLSAAAGSTFAPCALTFSYIRVSHDVPSSLNRTIIALAQDTSVFT